ncbi:MAG: efflux RND transporter periplasmic adaptor subunit [Thermodesulfobacteriota bacterium]
MAQRIFSYGLCLAFVFLGFGCGDKIEPGATRSESGKTVRAQVAVASMNAGQSFYEAVGTVQARTSSTIASKMMGAVKAVHVREGDTVEKNALLMELDDRQAASQSRGSRASLDEARRSLASAQAARDAARAGADLARATYDRYKKLLQEESVSRQEFDEIEARNRQASAALAQAEAMVAAAANRVQQAEAGTESADTTLTDAIIRAPYKGTITAKLIDVGAMASPGTPLLTMEMEGIFCVLLEVPEIHIGTVSLGQKLDVTIPSMENLVVQGTVGRIDPAADQQSRSFHVRVALPEGHDFRSGIFARVALPVGQAGMMMIPGSAIVRRGQLTGFYLVDDQNIARFRLLRTGRESGPSVEVISGMKDGDRYLPAPPPDMEDGVKVEVVS